MDIIFVQVLTKQKAHTTDIFVYFSFLSIFFLFFCQKKKTYLETFLYSVYNVEC